MIRFMNRNNLNPQSTVFQTRVRHTIANAFISITVVSSMPAIMLAVPVGLTLGGIRAIFGPKIADNKKPTSSESSEEDSGVSTEDVTSSEEDEKEMFDYRRVSSKLKLLERTENLGGQISEYLARRQKLALLVTLRDVFKLLQMTSEDSEGVVRVQYKKRKMKMMALRRAGVIQEILNATKDFEGSPVLIYFFKMSNSNSDDVDDAFRIQKISENRKFVHEVKEVIAEGAETKSLENSELEFVVVKKEGVVWVNAGF